MRITVTHYTKGSAPFYPVGEEHLSTQDALQDMIRRIKNGATTAMSGYNYGLVTYSEADGTPTGYDRAIYGDISPKLQDFLIRATKWQRQNGMEQGGAEHDKFIRRRLIEDTGQCLSDEELESALNMEEDDFLVAMAMAIETGESAAELFSIASP